MLLPKVQRWSKIFMVAQRHPPFWSSGKKATVVLREASPLSFAMAVTKASSQRCHHTLQGLTELESKQWQGEHC